MQDCKGSVSKADLFAETAISELLRGKIVPKLLKANGIKRESRPLIMPNDQVYTFHQSDIAALTKYLIFGNVEKAEGLVASHLAAGCPSTIVVSSLFSSAAQLMGDKWCDDGASFAEVTLGMMALHALLRSIEGAMSDEISPVREPGSVLLSVMPGDTHIFGISVLQSFFVASGWKVDMMVDPSVRGICERVANCNYEIVGLSVSTTKDISGCKSLLKLVRENSINKDLSCMVGGLPFILDDSLHSHVGADHMARDAFEALAIAASICERKQVFEASKEYV